MRALPLRRTGVAQLNYNHLHYFWVVATLGSIAKAARTLHVTPQTISGQLRTLEARLGSTLFAKAGRKLELTETGHIVRSYAEPMFALGGELRDVLKRNVRRRSSPFAVGLASSVPKLVAHRLLAPALDREVAARLVCSEGAIDSLVADLVAGRIDLVVTDSPVASTSPVRLQSHLVGQCGVTVFCSINLAERYRSRFPYSLDGTAFMIPAKTSPLRNALLDWFRRERIAPAVVAEVESPDLCSALCESRAALFALPTVIAREAELANRVAAVGEVPLELQFYAVSGVRDIGHELVTSVIRDARRRFAEGLGATDGTHSSPGDAV
jgi:LysR family transcriptional activator of nhaA